MRRTIAAVLAVTQVVVASQNVFSVHDDLLAFPQYELVFSPDFISESEASRIIHKASSARDAIDTKGLESQGPAPSTSPSVLSHAFDPTRETYELLSLNDEQHLCIIPIVNLPVRNETSEKIAKAAEAKELARATDRGWELLQELEGTCLYYHYGWWSYSFCYNKELSQFHQLPPQPGNSPQVPQRDMTTKQFILGRATSKKSADKEDEWGNDVTVPRVGNQAYDPPKTELQLKGDARYLVQRMEGGTTCDLTGKARNVEIQFHCSPSVDDHIGVIKELTTCSYQMLVYTPRLCSDVAFIPPKAEKPNQIECRIVVDDDDVDDRIELASLEASLDASAKPNPIIIGGVTLGGGKWMNKEGQRMPIPANFGKEPSLSGMIKETIAKASSKEKGGQVEMLSEQDLKKLDLDPAEMAKLRDQVQKMAKEKGWNIELVDRGGDERDVYAIVDADGEDEEDEGKSQEGSEEAYYKDEL